MRKINNISHQSISFLIRLQINWSDLTHRAAKRLHWIRKNVNLFRLLLELSVFNEQLQGMLNQLKTKK